MVTGPTSSVHKSIHLISIHITELFTPIPRPPLFALPILPSDLLRLPFLSRLLHKCLSHLDLIIQHPIRP